MKTIKDILSLFFLSLSVFKKFIIFSFFNNISNELNFNEINIVFLFKKCLFIIVARENYLIIKFLAISKAKNLIKMIHILDYL